MAFKADTIWLDGPLVDWDKASTHVLSHVEHYGTSAFEGVRCYKTKTGSGVMRLHDHIKRLFDSCKIYRMPVPFTIPQVEEAVLEPCVPTSSSRPISGPSSSAGSENSASILQNARSMLQWRLGTGENTSGRKPSKKVSVSASPPGGEQPRIPSPRWPRSGPIT